MLRDVVYAPAGWPQALRADVYVPNTAGMHPGVVVVHGGSWAGRDRSDMDSISRRLARHGYVVANIDYRLAPAFRFPAQVDDVRQATRWLREQAGTFSVDPKRIGAWGYSAGAHLVALAATDNHDPHTALQAVVTCALPSDLRSYPDSPIITTFIGATSAAAPATWRDASPIAHVSQASPPMFLYHGTWDLMVDVKDSVRMKQSLDEAGVPAELYLVRGAGHLTTFVFGFGGESAGVEFLDRRL